MSFRKRFLYYLYGFGIGIIITFFMFRNRGCEWTPGNRVLVQLSNSQLLISDSVRCVLKSNGMDENSIYEILKNGKVDFSDSETQANPKKYAIENTVSKKTIVFLLPNDSVAIVNGVHNGIAGKCDLASPVEKILIMPEKTVKQILSANEISSTDSVYVKMKAAGIKESDIYNLIQTGKIDFDKSIPNNKPHPLYYVVKNKFQFSIEVTESKTRILDFKEE